jgi:hypothetical protein
LTGTGSILSPGFIVDGTKLYIPESGNYDIALGVAVATFAAVGDWVALGVVKKNGTSTLTITNTYVPFLSGTVSAIRAANASKTVVLPLSAGDYLELIIYVRYGTPSGTVYTNTESYLYVKRNVS